MQIGKVIRAALHAANDKNLVLPRILFQTDWLVPLEFDFQHSLHSVGKCSDKDYEGWVLLLVAFGLVQNGQHFVGL